MNLPAGYLAKRYQQDVFRAAYSVGRNRQDAEDATQDAFAQYLRALRAGKEFEGEEHAKAWLLRVAINRSRSEATSFWSRNKVALDEGAAEDIEDLSIASPEDRELVEAVMSLPARYRAAVHLHYWEGYSVAQIAKTLHITQASAKKRLFEGRKLLKGMLEGGSGDERAT